jgi:preprotein translocase subunit YajC
MQQLLTSLLPWIAVLVVFYLLLILPEQRKQKKFKSMVESLKVGDEVFTRSGIVGKIVNLKDEFMVIESGAEFQLFCKVHISNHYMIFICKLGNRLHHYIPFLMIYKVILSYISR